MPPRNPELPEGTDHIINGAMETNGGIDSDFGGASGTGFVGSGVGDDTGGTSMVEGRSVAGSDIKAQLRDGVSGLQSQAGDKVRAYAETGKSKATGALDEFSQVVSDAATTIDERLGSEYGEYARRAADAVSGFADTLRNKEVDELFDDGRELVRKSPGVAIGVAAVVGFTLIRLLKAGMDNGRRTGEREIEFEPDLDGPSRSISTNASSPTGGMGTGV
ncbi:MAG: hypothetical protein H0W74_02505 [Sphingosinicella sp.]|nr:hypothetical protein [Sphingosinicella sp.]